MIHLSTIVGIFDIVLFSVLYSLPLTFIFLFPRCWRRWSTSSNWKRAIVVLHVILSAACVIIIPLVTPPMHENPRVNDAGTINTFLSIYRIDFGVSPSGSNAEILLELSKSDFMAYKIKRADIKVNKKGEWVDPWDTPFQFQINAGYGRLEAYSAGPDRVFSTDDDIPENLGTKSIEPLNRETGN